MWFSMLMYTVSLFTLKGAWYVKEGRVTCLMVGIVCLAFGTIALLEFTS